MTKTDTAPDVSAKKTGGMAETWETLKTVFYALAIAFVIRTLLFQPYTIPSASEQPNLYQGDYIIVTKWSYGYSHHSILFSPPIFKGRLFFTPPTRGDIVVFKLPRDGHTDYIKRLIGLPGDKVQYLGGRLFINGRQTAERRVKTVIATDRGAPETVAIDEETNPEGRRYRIQDDGPAEAADNTGVYVVPPHCYFMLGDNRDNSADSRFDPGLAPEDAKLGGCGWDSRVDAQLGFETGVGFVPEENLVGRARIIMISWNDKASLFKPWTWVLNLRPSRFLTILK